MATTNIQNKEALRKGSVKVSIGDDFDSLVDIGALREPVLTSLVQNHSIEFDNTDELKKFVDGKKIQFTFDLTEINLTNLEKLESGLVNLTTQSGTIVSGEVQTVSSGDWGYNDFIKIENQNADGSAITVNSVSAGTNGALVEDTDYYIGTNENGDYGIFVIDSTTVTTEDQTISIDYDYTPAASKKITFNDKGTKDANAVVRLENVDENDKVFRVDIEKVTNMTAPTISFAADTEEDVAVSSLQLEGEIVEILDEQQTS